MNRFIADPAPITDELNAMAHVHTDHGKQDHVSDLGNLTQRAGKKNSITFTTYAIDIAEC